MTRRGWVWTTLVLAAAAALLAPTVQAEKKPVTPVKEVKGTVEDEKLSKDAPEVVTRAAELEKLWKAWKPAEKMPEVDFTKDLVLVATTRGSQLKTNVTLDDEIGNLIAVTVGTADLRPGFRYLLTVVPKQGVKTVNNKELPKE